MTTQETVAANVRARLAWGRISHDVAARAAGCSVRSFRYRIAGEYPFQIDELTGLAELLGLDDLGVFFRVPDGFGDLRTSAHGEDELRSHGAAGYRWLVAA